MGFTVVNLDCETDEFFTGLNEAYNIGICFAL
jgi:hypothetical protein